MDREDIMDGLSLDELDELEAGPHGYHLESGFEVVTDDPRVPDGVVIIPLAAVLCKSRRHPAPQLRYLSPHELERGQLEVADRIYGVRIDVPGEDLSRLVVGRRDDLAEVAIEHGRRWAVGLGLQQVARVISWAARLPGLVREAVARIGGRR